MSKVGHQGHKSREHCLDFVGVVNDDEIRIAHNFVAHRLLVLHLQECLRTFQYPFHVFKSHFCTSDVTMQCCWPKRTFSHVEGTEGCVHVICKRQPHFPSQHELKNNLTNQIIMLACSKQWPSTNRFSYPPPPLCTKGDTYIWSGYLTKATESGERRAGIEAFGECGFEEGGVGKAEEAQGEMELESEQMSQTRKQSLQDENQELRI